MLTRGQIINGTYEVRGPIGEGSAGEVYLGWHLNLQKQVVIKKIKDRFVGHINERQEADILKKLRHQYLPQVYDFLQTGGEVYTIIDYIDGDPMADYIKNGVRFSEAQIIKWLRDLLSVLSYLHTQTPPIIHNDIKPSNIMITSDGDIALIDFNISFGQYEDRDLSGFTAGYASPEQIYRMQLYSSGGNFREVVLDARSDIFSLGVSFYSLMCGRAPKSVPQGGLADFGQNTPYSPQLRAIITRATNPDREMRYHSAAEMLADLESIKRRDEEYVKLRRRQRIFTLVSLAAFAIGLVMAWIGFAEKREEAFLAEADAVLAGESENLTADVGSIFNDKNYTQALRRNPETAALLLYTAGNAHFEAEEYAQAIPYYEEAESYSKENPALLRDHAIALVRSGDTAGAEKILYEARELGVRSDALSLIESELALADGNADMAYSAALTVIAETSDETAKARAYIDAAAAAELAGNREEAARLLAEGSNVLTGTQGMRVLRELGSLYVRMLTYNPEMAPQILPEAERVLRVLYADTAANADDILNLSQVLEMQEKYEEAEGILTDCAGRYETDYRFPMRLALCEIRRMGMLAEEERDYTAAAAFYNEAAALYEEAGLPGDASMDILRTAMDDLAAGGWITKE